MRVFVAASADEWLPAKVLEFSIRETTAAPVDVQRIESFGRQIPMPALRRNQPRTPFSFQRFLIPELCGYQGRAVYLDADMQVFCDMLALWETPMGDHDLLTVDEGGHGRKGQFSVMLLDCARLAWRIDDIIAGLDRGDYSYEALMQEMCVAHGLGRHLDPGWNSLERYDPLSTRLLHYTDMNTQPWVDTSNPLAHLWVACLRRAIGDGFLTRDDVQREVTLGRVRPSLLTQIESGEDQPSALTPAERDADRAFQAPYRRLVRSPWRRWASSAQSLLRGR